MSAGDIDYGTAIANISPPSKPRPYQSPRREAQARRTRQRIVAAATTTFLAHGYAAATIRAIATEAGVSVPTVELLFGTKARLLKATIDVAIAGDDEPVPMLERSWARTANRAATVDELLEVAADVIGPAQVRSSGLVLAVFEGAPSDPELGALAEQMITQRATTAAWLVDAMAQKAPRREGCTRKEAIDTVWLLMDPVVFVRLTRLRRWTVPRYQRWLAGSIRRLLIV
jgi:AcrR family transcriptional regulator